MALSQTRNIRLVVAACCGLFLLAATFPASGQALPGQSLAAQPGPISVAARPTNEIREVAYFDARQEAASNASAPDADSLLQKHLTFDACVLSGCCIVFVLGVLAASASMLSSSTARAR